MPYVGLPADADIPTIPAGGYAGLPDDAVIPTLNRKEQVAKGAAMTPQESSDYMAQRAAFANQGGVKMFAKIPPTDTRKISYTDTGYKPNKPATSLKEFAKNAVQDVVEAPLFPVRMASDIINAPDTVDAVANTAKSIVTTPLGFVPYVSEMATGRTAADNWLTNPGLGAMTVLGGAELAKTGGPKVADFAVDGTRKAANAIGIPKALDATANKLYDMTLKQGTTLKPEIRAQNLETGLEGQYLPNSKGVDKLAGDIGATEQKLGAGIAAGDAANVTGTLDRAIANVNGLREQAKRSANPDRNLALIDAEIERLRGNPTQSPTGDIPIGELQKMKVEQGRQVKYQQKMNQAVDPFQASIDKARIRGLREELEARLAGSFPELADTNRQLGRMYQLQDVLERAANRIENNQGIGIGLPIKGGSGGVMGGMIGGPAGAAIGSGIGTLIGIIEHPAVAPRIALALRRAVKGLSKEEATTITNNRLGGLTDGLIQRQQTVLDSESLPKVSNDTLGDVVNPAAYQQTYDWSGKPPAPEPVANPEQLPPPSVVTNLGDELRANDYAPVHGWEGKQAAPMVANPEALPPRQSSQMPQVSEQGGRIVPHVEAMTPRVPEGFNPEVVGLGPEDVQLGDRIAPKPRPLRNIPETQGNTDAQIPSVAGIPAPVDTSVFTENAQLKPNVHQLYRGDSIHDDGIGDGSVGDLGKGIYFTDSSIPAEYFTDGTDASHTRKFNVHIDHPLDLMDRNIAKDPSWQAMMDTLPEDPAIGQKPKSNLQKWADGKLDVKNVYNFLAGSFGMKPEAFNDFLAKHGYDAVIDQGVRGIADGGTQVVVFDKSRVAKNGTENPSSKVDALPPAAHTWQSYLAAHMSRAMKETGDHGKAMKLLGEEWRKDKSKDPLGIRGGKK